MTSTKDDYATAIEALKDSLRSANEAIGKLNFGVDGSVAVKTPGDWAMWLSYGVVDGETDKSLYIELCNSDDGIKQCDLFSFDFSILSLIAQAVPELVDIMKTRAAGDNRWKDIQETANQLNDFLRELESEK